MSHSQGRLKPGQVVMNIAISAEVRAALKARAALDNMTMFEKLHEILCDALERSDLKEEQDAAVPA